MSGGSSIEFGTFHTIKTAAMINAIIVEDEKSSRNNLKNLLAMYCKDVTVTGEAGTIEEGVALLKAKSEQTDVAFLDINLPDGLVFQLLNQFEEKNFDIIFVTAYDKFAMQACEYSCIGYITKPIDPEKLESAVSRIRTRKNPQTNMRYDVFKSFYGKNPYSKPKICIPYNDEVFLVPVSEIIRLQSEDNYTHFFLKDGRKLTASKTIKSFEKPLENYSFLRIHRSHIINMNHIEKYVRGEGGSVVMEGGAQIEVSRRKRAAFLEKLRMLQEEFKLNFN